MSLTASVVESKDFRDGTCFPLLMVYATDASNKEELRSLEQIEEALVDIVGRAYGGKLVTTQKGSGQHGIFCVDMSSVLTLLKAIQVDGNKRELANAWIHNWLKDKVRPEWMSAEQRAKLKPKHDFGCRCGKEFKSKKKQRRHQRRCVILTSLERLFIRIDEALERIGDGRKKEKSASTRKSRKAKGHRSKKAAKAEKPVRRTKARRSSRSHRKNKK